MNNRNSPIWMATPAEIARRGPRLHEQFRKRWPAAFADFRPLKIGIRADLSAAGAEPMDTRIFLSWYVQQPEYLAAQAQSGAERIGLDGQPCGNVSDDNAAYAAQRHDELKYRQFRRALLDGAGA